MRVLIDIGHPAHVHYYRNFIKEMKKNGHEFCIVARERGVIFSLLTYYNLEFTSRGKGGKTLIKKVFYSFRSMYILLKTGFKFKPDVFLSQGGVYSAPIARILGTLSISTEDTENATLSHRIAKTFGSTIISPSCFEFKISDRHIKFDSYQELFYLHPNYFNPDSSIRNELGLNENEKFVLIRFVDWNAHHDIGHKGLSLQNKIKVVRELESKLKVFILSEDILPDSLDEFKISVSPERMHDVLKEAQFLFGESSTMASECACLGTPAIFIDKKGRGYTNEQEKLYQLVYNFSDTEEDQKAAIIKAIEMANDQYLTAKSNSSYLQLLNDKIDPTKFLLDYFENLNLQY